jgi:hypothetical protein
MEWTQALKELAAAVEARNHRVARLRAAGSDVAELTAQALTANAPGPPLQRILAGMEPLIAQERPHVCGQSPVIPPRRSAYLPPQLADPPSVRQQSAEDDVFGPVRYTLGEVWEKGILPWKPPTARTYRKRSFERGVPVPKGERTGRSSATPRTNCAPGERSGSSRPVTCDTEGWTGCHRSWTERSSRQRGWTTAAHAGVGGTAASRCKRDHRLSHSRHPCRGSHRVTRWHPAEPPCLGRQLRLIMRG